MFVFIFNIFICHYGPLKSLIDLIDVLSCCTLFYFTYLQILKISLTSASFCKQQLFFSDIHCCITDTVPCQDRCFGADASSSCIRKCFFLWKDFLRTRQMSSYAFSSFLNLGKRESACFCSLLFFSILKNPSLLFFNSFNS